MNNEPGTRKEPMSQEKIFKVMLTMTFVIASVFFLKNIFSQSWGGAIAIGICLVIFSAITAILNKMNVNQYTKQFALCVELPLLVFFISIFSGAYYSDDFPMFLAVIGLSGIYLEANYTRVQMIEIPILLALMYIIHPEKADPLSQYIMCVVIFIVAAYTFSMTIARGRAFIEMSLEKTAEAERFLASIKEVGEELQENYEVSSGRIKGMREANKRLEENTTELKKGSDSITAGTLEVETTCDKVHEYMQITEGHVHELNQEIKQVEEAMSANKENMQTMDKHMQSVKKTVGATKTVFAQLQQQIQEISDATGQLTSIATNTKMLALNASIEAARAGEAGAGFAVVATQVQGLAVDSSNCSNQVVSVVENMKNQIEVTTEQLDESVAAINNSLESLVGLQSGFDELIQSFTSLYTNIEEQNQNVQNVDSIFGSLHSKVGEMSSYSEENQAVVESIIDTMLSYREHMNRIVDDMKTISKLSSSMLAISRNKAV